MDGDSDPHSDHDSSRFSSARCSTKFPHET
jgi:hypothetical protein